MSYEIEFESRGNSNELIVLVHGYVANRERLADVEKVIKEQFPNADLLKPRYKSLISDTACDIASYMEASIQDRFDEQTKNGQPYEKIILIAHSMGCLLLRKAYVYGCGRREDHPNSQNYNRHEWVEKVDRIVLIACMNRGWCLDKKPKNLGWLRYVVLKFLNMFLSFFSCSRFLKSLERGTPFVANLRLQWIRL